MDKRRSPRYPISLNALVHPNEGRSWLCSIRDFCDGGMLLVEQGASRSRRSMPGITTGGTVGIHFSVPTGSNEKHFRLEGKIVRVMDSGVGINFPEGMDEDAMTSLLNYSTVSSSLEEETASEPEATAPREATTRPARSGAGNNAQAQTNTPAAENEETDAGAARRAAGISRPAANGRRGGSGQDLDLAAEKGHRGPIKPADSKRIIAAVRREVAKVMPEMNSAFFSYMDEELLKLARDAKTNAEQSEYFAAMSNLEKAKKSVG